MTDKQNSDDFPAFNLFIKLFENALNCSFDGETITLDKKQIDKTKLSLLLVWPDILAFKFASLTGDKEYQNHLNKLEALLNGEATHQEIHDTLNNFIWPEPIPQILFDQINEAKKNGNSSEEKKLKKQLRDYIPKIFKTFTLLLHPKSIHFNQEEVASDYVFTLGNYSILCCIIFKLLNENTEETFITREDIYKLFKQLGVNNQLDINKFSIIWTENMTDMADRTLREYIYGDASSFKYQNSEPIPKTELFLHKYSDGFIHLARIDRHKKYDTDSDPIGYAIDINLFNTLDYHLWQIETRNEIGEEYESLVGSYLFSGTPKKNILKELVLRLVTKAKQGSLITKILMNSWDSFIDEPKDIVESRFDEYDEWILGLLENHEAREELLNFKSLTRMIGSFDIESDNERVKETRAVFKEAYFYHIQTELKQKLLEADDELTFFVNKVINKLKRQDEGLWDEKNLIKFFNKHKNKFNYLNLLDPDDIKKIIFFSGGTSQRDNRRAILPVINKKLGGRTYRGKSTLTKLLGLETGKEKYLKYK